MNHNLKVMAIGAHPDDIEVYMSGTMTKYRNQGCDLYYVIATDGSKGGKENPEKLSIMRKKEAKGSAAYLDVDPIFMDFKDGELMYNHDSYKKVIQLIHTIRPDIIFTHNPNDYHADHRVLSKLVFDAASFKVPVVYADSLMGTNFIPQFYIDITEEFELKEEMLLKHGSQQYTGIFEMVKLWSHFRGVQATGEINKYAEAYALATLYKSANVLKMLPIE